MVNQSPIEATYISAADMDDPDTAADFDTFADEMRQSESADAWITVTRVPMDAQGNPRANTKHSSHLFQEPLGANTVVDIIERIRRDFMTPGEKGMFRVIGSQKGRQGIKFNKLLTIERGKEKGEAAGNDSFSQVMRAMQESQRLADERAERMISALTTRVSPGADPIDQMTKMMTAMGAMMGPMMAVMAGRPMTPTPDPTDSLVKLATTMKTLNGMFGGGAGTEAEDTSSLASIVKAIAPMAGPALQLMVEGKRGENLRLARQPKLAAPAKVAPKVIPAAPKGSETPKAAPGAPATADATSNVETPLTPEEQEIKNMELAELKKNLDTVVDLCESGRAPEQVAKLVLAAVPQEKDEEFLALLDDDDYVNNMALLNPRVEPHREWFEKLRGALLAEYEPDNTGS